MDYRKLNSWTEKDHFPIPFMDQMFDRLAGKGWYCFLDGYSGYNQISIAPEDQEKTTFTCPYETFAFKRMFVWVMLCTRHILEMYDVDIFRHGGRYYRSFYG